MHAGIILVNVLTIHNFLYLYNRLKKSNPFHVTNKINCFETLLICLALKYDRNKRYIFHCLSAVQTINCFQAMEITSSQETIKIKEIFKKIFSAQK
jgi:hypothetical protein